MENSFFSFNRSDLLLFIISFAFLLSGFLVMAFDPTEYGFGFMTLNLAPFLLLAGFTLPLFGILGFSNIQELVKRKSSLSNFKTNKWQKAGGVSVFLISLVTYLITLEPTASLWDCSEFIACAYKLQVPHTPGNPFFLLMGRIFTMLAMGDHTKIAWWMNVMSALFASGAVFFIFRIIIMLGKSVMTKLNIPEIVLIFAAIAGSLAMAFIDSYWFSAVEAETYAAGSFFLVLNVWLGLKYAELRSVDLRNRWIVLTTYISGLSFCVHPMALLAIPVIAVVWYLEKRPLNFKNVVVSLGLGLGILLFINRFIAVGIFEMAFRTDLFLVNKLGMPFYSGAFLYLILIISLSVYLMKVKPKFNTVNWSFLFLIVGFLPYLVLFIRSNFNPPIDETNPEDLASIKAYMNRESYPSRPLVYGPYYDADIIDYQNGKKAFYRDDESYKIAGTRVAYQYDPKRTTILPRMYSRDEAHVEQYQAWARLKPDEKPDFLDNLKYLFRYQLGHMYFRYLMWNFSGRVSDVQHDGWLKPWESSDQKIYNRAGNQYYMIPFILGLLGMVFLYQNDKKGFLTSLTFFLITGIVLSLYLNSPPQEPRERDYIFVGSFMAFCIWLALGILSLYLWLKRIKISKKLTVFLLLCISCAVPGWILLQNFDDHNRSGRTIQIDAARNLLNTCEPNAILFTGGDNDTFPLWYLQEVEGFRTDVRVIVLSYFNTDWYIEQLSRKYYLSNAFKMTLDKYDYKQYGPNDVVYYRKNKDIKGSIDAEKFIHLLHDEHPALRVKTSDGDPVSIIPSKWVNIQVDTDAASRKLNIPGDMLPHLQKNISLKLKNNYLEKNTLVFLDLIISNNWDRPIYFNYTSMNAIGVDVKPYLVQEGQLFQFLPVKTNDNRPLVNREKMYRHLIDTNDFDNLKNEHIYLNHEDYISRIVVPLDQYFNNLAMSYLSDGDEVNAIKTMEKALELFYSSHIPSTFNDVQTMQILLALNEKNEAIKIGDRSFRYYSDKLKDKDYDSGGARFDGYILQQIAAILTQIGESKYQKELEALL